MVKKKVGKINNLKPDKDTLLATGIQEKINGMFYNQPKHKEELKMLKHMWENEEEERLGLHASSITSKKDICYKEQLINILYKHYKDNDPDNMPKTIYNKFKEQARENRNNPVHLQRIFEQGTTMGYKWQMLFIRAGVGKKEDMDVSRFVDEYDLSYTPDAIIELDGKKYVVELKSQNQNRFDNDKSHPDGIKQLKLYMYFEGIDRGFVLVDNKNNSKFKVLLINGINESDDDIADYLQKLEKLQKMKKYALKKKKMPKCNCKKCSK